MRKKINVNNDLVRFARRIGKRVDKWPLWKRKALAAMGMYNKVKP